MHVIDLNEEHYPAQLTTTWDGELNGSVSLSAIIKPSKVNLQFIHNITEMWRIVDDDDTEYKIIYCKRRGTGNLMTVDVKALPKYQDDLNNQRVYERYDQHMTANAYFHLTFDGSGYNFILNGTFEAQQWEGLGEGSTRLEMLKNGLNRYKAEFRISGNTIYIENQIGNDTSHRYEHRLNASNIVQEIDANEFWTYAKGYGDYGDGEGGEDWQDAKLIREYTSPLAQIPAIGIREAPPIKNGNITTTATMDSQLKILVDESLKISVTADVHDLTKQGYPIAQSQLGDRVFLIDPRIGFDEEIRVSHKSITKDWTGKIIALNLTFGAPGLVKRHQSNLNAAMKNITQLLEGKIKLPFSVLDSAVAEATKALLGAQTELTFSENGILAVDKNNPNFVVLLNSAGIGVSTDGGNTFENAITGNGINASVIVTGILHGITIVQESGNRSLEMSNGELFSYYNNQLAMKFGQFSLDFYNRNQNLLGQIVPLTNENNSTYEGLGLIVENDFINIGMRSGGFIRPVLRSSFYDNTTILSGPYSNANAGASLQLLANRRLASESRFSTIDQPAIILDQSDTTNDIDVYYGGFGRRLNASVYFRHRTTDSSSTVKMRVAPDYVRIYDELRVGGENNPSGIYTFGNSVHWRYDVNNYIRQQDNGRVEFYAGNNVRHSFDSNGNASFNGSVDVGGSLRAISAYNETTSNAANVHVFADTGRFVRSTSARKYKEDIQVASDVDYEKILELDVKSWYDKGEVSRNNGSTDGLKRYYGLIANEFEEVGLSQFGIYEKEEIENYSDRAWALLIPIVRDLKEEVKSLKEEVKTLKEGWNGGNK